MLRAICDEELLFDRIIEQKITVFIGGADDSGKTTLANKLLRRIPLKENVGIVDYWKELVETNPNWPVFKLDLFSSETSFYKLFEAQVKRWVIDELPSLYPEEKEIYAREFLGKIVDGKYPGSVIVSPGSIRGVKGLLYTQFGMEGVSKILILLNKRLYDPRKFELYGWCVPKVWECLGFGN